MKHRRQVTFPVELSAWLAWQAAMEQKSQEDILVEALLDLHKKRKAADPRTPDLEMPKPARRAKA